MPTRRRRLAGGSRFLFPVRALSGVFRAKYLEGLARLSDENAIDVPPHLADTQRGLPRGWLRRLRRKPWVVYSKSPFAGPQKLLDYLGRYTHRVAISNDRILSCDSDTVTFTYRDRADGGRRKRAELDATTFIGRFLTHVLPRGFCRIRHYGFLANRSKQQALEQCRTLLDASPVTPQGESPQTTADWLQLLLGIDIHSCPQCHGPLRWEALPRSQPIVHPLSPNCRDP